MQDIGLQAVGQRNYYGVGIVTANIPANACGPLGTTSCAATQWDAAGAVTTACSTAPADGGAAVSVNIPLKANTVFNPAAGVAANLASMNNLAAALPAATTAVAKNSFVVGAEGNIAGAAAWTAAQVDAWTINQNKVFTNVNNGLIAP